VRGVIIVVLPCLMGRPGVATVGAVVYA